MPGDESLNRLGVAFNSSDLKVPGWIVTLNVCPSRGYQVSFSRQRGDSVEIISPSRGLRAALPTWVASEAVEDAHHLAKAVPCLRWDNLQVIRL